MCLNRARTVLSGGRIARYVPTGKQMCLFADRLSADEMKGNQLRLYSNREFPRLCRGGSSSLTFAGVHPGNSKS